MGSAKTFLLWLALARVACCQGDALTVRIQQLVPAAEQEQLLNALRGRDYALVRRMLDAKASDTGKRPEVIAIEGALAFVQGDMRGASQSFKTASRLKPLSEADSFTWAMALVKLDDHATSRQVLTSLQAVHPDNPLYIYWLAKIDYGERRYSEAETKLQQALKIDPASARVWDSLGLVYDMQGQVEEAQADFEKAVALNRQSAHPSAWPPHNLGYLLLRLGRAAEAEAFFRESLRYQPMLVESHYHLGRALEKQEQYEAAINQYRLAVDGDSSARDACYSLAMLYRKLKRDPESAAMFAEYKRRKEKTDEPAPQEMVAK